MDDLVILQMGKYKQGKIRWLSLIFLSKSSRDLKASLSLVQFPLLTPNHFLLFHPLSWFNIFLSTHSVWGTTGSDMLF